MFNGYIIGTTTIAETKNANEIPITCKNICPPCKYISAVFPRTSMADIKDMKIDAVTGNTDNCLLPTKNSLRNEDT